MPKSRQRKKKSLIQVIKVPTTVTRMTDDGKMVVVKNYDKNAGGYKIVKHKPRPL